MLVSAHYDKNNIKMLDQVIKFPVSRSQVLNAILAKVLENPDYLNAIINHEQEKIERKIAESAIN